MAMAPRNQPLGGMYVGQGGQMMTPAQVAEQRSVARALAETASDTSPVGHWAAALNRGLQGYIAGRDIRQANDVESSETARALAAFEARNGTPTTTSPVVDALAGGHSPADGHDHSNMSAADWLTYSNQGATRNQPIAASLVEAMSFLPEMGITMDVYSGGQDAEGPNRVGSTRHDHGNAADVTFRDASGRMLDWNNPDDIPVLQNIVSTARANGVTGFGAGDDYMGAGRMHIGFGNPGVWGAGGSGANAPEWLRQAYGAAQTAPAGAGVAAGPSAGGVSQIAALLADPWMPEPARRVLEAQLAQQVSMQNAAYEAQLQNQDPLRQLQIQQAELELQQLQNPTVEPVEINGQLVNPLTGEVLGDYRTQSAPEAPTTQTFFDEATGQEYRAQWNPTTQAWDRVGGVAAPSGSLVTVNNGGQDAFNEAFGKADATTIAGVSDAGLAAARAAEQINALEGVLAQAPSGAAAMWTAKANELGIDIGGAGPVAAAQAIINAMVPAQRPPGSGPMSDADLELFKQSLPRLVNTAEGNTLILQTMRQINAYDQEGARIAQDLRAGRITRDQAFDMLQNRANPMANFNQQASAFPASAPVAAAPSSMPPPVQAPAAIPDFSVMLPEEIGAYINANGIESLPDEVIEMLIARGDL